MDVVNLVIFHLVIISDTTNKFLPVENKDLLNWIDLKNTLPDRRGTLDVTATYILL